MAELSQFLSQFLLLLGLAVVCFSIVFTFFYKAVLVAFKKYNLTKHGANPVLSPEIYSEWESQGTFNPAAITDDAGNVHIIYRAIGGDGVSRFGYLASRDGVSVDDKSPYPVFSMVNPRYGTAGEERRFDPVMYPSGGSWGGAEDPRMVRIDGRIYLTYSAFDGWDYIRMAVVSIDEKDFLNKKWKWSRPLLISPPGKITKNWVLFPEKINGKFAVIHSIVPEIQIAYVDKLNNLTQIKSPRPFGPQPGRKDYWDNLVRGAGPPPIKTKEGWLLLYHGQTKGDHRYKLGAMLLDLDDPTKIIRRGPAPILFSDTWYENDWKPGIVYACGAVVKADNLLVYYGGGDKHVCVAHTPLNQLLEWLLEYGKV